MSLAHFYIHHGGEKGVGGTLMGRGRQGFTGAFLLLFLMQLGLPPGLETPGWSCLSLPLTQQRGPFRGFGVSVGLGSLLGLAPRTPMLGFLSLTGLRRGRSCLTLQTCSQLRFPFPGKKKPFQILGEGVLLWAVSAGARLPPAGWGLNLPGVRGAQLLLLTRLPLGRGLGCPPCLGELPALGFSGGRLVAHHHAPRPSQPQ